MGRVSRAPIAQFSPVCPSMMGHSGQHSWLVRCVRTSMYMLISLGGWGGSNSSHPSASADA